MCIHAEHYEQLLNLDPKLPERQAKESLMIPVSPMPGSITVKHRGASVMRVEIAFNTEQQGKLSPDHKMLVKVDMYHRKAIPESIWFRCKGTTHTRVPKKGIDDGIQTVLTNRLHAWLEMLSASAATVH
jgi:hypothetical protein